MPKVKNSQGKNSAKDRQRGFVVTQWNVDLTNEDYERLMELHGIRFLAYGLETCPTTQRKHHQLYMYFENPKSIGEKTLGKMGKMFGKTHCRVAPMRGTFKQNEEYCSKESTLVKLGKEPSQGERSDIKEIVQAIADGKTNTDELLMENPMIVHQYQRIFDYAWKLRLRGQFRKWMTKGIWYWGKSGAGKSRKAFENFHPNTHFVKVLEEKWWDGYKGQETVIFNEFRGDAMTLHYLFALVDMYPMQVSWRNREAVPFLAKRVIITCIKHPKEIYSMALGEGGESWEQFERRFEVIEVIKDQQPALQRQLAVHPAACFPEADLPPRVLARETPTPEPVVIPETSDEGEDWSESE